MKFLATFYTHFGAMRFDRYCRDAGIPAKKAPVPRELSASCGVCVFFDAAAAPKIAEHEDMEKCYTVDADGNFMPHDG